jgi:hypothetical protein
LALNNNHSLTPTVNVILLRPTVNAILFNIFYLQLFIFTAGEHIDKKVSEINKKYERIQDIDLNDEENKASFLEHLLGKENLPLDSVYANTTELMLAGLDTVCFFKL